jgi:hypothetical protein
MTQIHVIISGGGFESMYVKNMLAGNLSHIYDTPLAKGDHVAIVHVNYGHLAALQEASAVIQQKKIFNHTESSVWFFEKEDMFSEEEKNNCLLFTGDLLNSPQLPNRNKKIIDFVLSELERLPLISTKDAKFYVGFEPKDSPYPDCTADFLEKNYPGYSFSAPILSIFSTEDSYLESLETENLSGLETVWTCWTPVAGEKCCKCSHCKKEHLIDKYRTKPE